MMRYKAGDIVVIGYKNSRQPITVEVRGVNDDCYLLRDGIKKLYLCPEEMIDHEATERLDIDLVSEKNKEIAQMFTKDDLETGMVAELSNGERMLIVGEVLLGKEKWGSLKEYDKRLNHQREGSNIDKVFKSECEFHMLSKYFHRLNDMHLIWNREYNNKTKEITEKYTIEELERAIKLMKEKR